MKNENIVTRLIGMYPLHLTNFGTTWRTVEKKSTGHALVLSVHTTNNRPLRDTRAY